MDIQMHGQKIGSFDASDSNAMPGRRITSIPGRVEFHLSATYHGDHDEFWIVETDGNGNETGRHNARFVERIVWQTPIIKQQ